MPRTLSNAGTLDANAPNREEIWMFLVVIDHPTLNAPIRFINNDETIVVGTAPNERIYLPVGLKINIPDEDPDQLPQVTLSIADIDRSILTILRGIPIQNSPRPTAEMSLVLASSVEVVEAGPFKMEILMHTRQGSLLTMTLGTDNLVRRPFPGKQILPQFFPNLF